MDGGEGNQTREKGRRRRWRNRERLKPQALPQMSHLHRVRTRLRRLGFVSFCWSPRRRARRACCASCVWWAWRSFLISIAILFRSLLFEAWSSSRPVCVLGLVSNTLPIVVALCSPVGGGFVLDIGLAADRRAH